MSTSDLEELWTAYTEQGEPVTSGGITKAQAAAGMLHASCGVWLWRDNQGEQEILVARRSELVHTWPGLYGLSSGGHVNFGNSVVETAIRETSEELGINLKPSQLELLMAYRSYMPEAGVNIIENDLAYIYAAKISGNETIRFTDKEVSEVRWLNLDDLCRLMAGDMHGLAFVPQGQAVGSMMAVLLNEQWQRYVAKRS